MSRLLIVSNRLPVTVSAEGDGITVVPSSGGLATGLSGPHQKLESLWIGWPGDTSRMNSSQKKDLARRLEELRTQPVFLTSTEVNRYYQGFSNGVLWPLFHHLIDTVQRDAWRDWKTYLSVNQRFAEAVASAHRPGDLVWVHDYQLALVPVLLRQLVPEAVIGFFLHIPFPSSEAFRALPWRTEVLEGMAGADLVGLHTYSYVRHFLRTATVLLDVSVEGQRIRYGDREIRVGVFPMGIDAAEFDRMARTPEVLDEASKIRSDCGERKLLLGVDRLDYTKGLPRRMMAVERLLEEHPELVDEVRLIQVVVPSRGKVESYRQLRKTLDEVVGRINAAHGTVGSVPIHYLYHSIPQTQLVALYKAADVMLVTPLRDGMNLVAKEFVACRTGEDGVLVLSEFAGAADELAEAVRVNPYDVNRMASTIHRALTMPEEEAAVRMRALRRRVQTFDSYRWAENFLSALTEAANRRKAQPIRVTGSRELDFLTERARAASHLLLLSTYDGTLTPFASAPELAAPDADLLDLLKALANRPRTSVHLLCGRTKETMERWFGGLPIGLYAEHGYWFRQSLGDPWETEGAEADAWKSSVLAILQPFTLNTPGTLLEEKTASLTWHYRMADPEFGAMRSKELQALLEESLAGLPVRVVPGNKFVEIRHQSLSKGLSVARILDASPPGSLVVALGGDRSEEEFFQAIPEGGITVHVGQKPSGARYRLAAPADARALLGALLEACEPIDAPFAAPLE